MSARLAADSHARTTRPRPFPPGDRTRLATDTFGPNTDYVYVAGYSAISIYDCILCGTEYRGNFAATGLVRHHGSYAGFNPLTLASGTVGETIAACNPLTLSSGTAGETIAGFNPPALSLGNLGGAIINFEGTFGEFKARAGSTATVEMVRLNGTAQANLARLVGAMAPQAERIEKVSEPGASLLTAEFPSESQTSGNSALILGALQDLTAFQIENWDAEGARAVTQAIINEATRLLSSLPVTVPPPDVAPARDGSLCMEWESPVGTLWLDIGADRTAQMLLEIGTFGHEKRFRADDPDLATDLRVAAQSLFPAKQPVAIRSIVVPA